MRKVMRLLKKSRKMRNTFHSVTPWVLVTYRGRCYAWNANTNQLYEFEEKPNMIWTAVVRY